MISKLRHSETTSKGEPLYIVECFYRDPETGKISNIQNREYSKELCKVKFYNGIGKTKFRSKAQLFSEQFEYVIKLHKDVEPWVEAKTGQASSTTEVLPEDDAYDIEDEEEETE